MHGSESESEGFVKAPHTDSPGVGVYLLSKPMTAERFNAVVRSHWGIENRLHWRLDVIMNEDQDRTIARIISRSCVTWR